MTENWKNRVLIALFLVAISVPTIWGLAFSAPAVPASENRAPAKMPTLVLKRKSIKEFPGQFEKFFNDRIGFRAQLLDVQQWLKREVFDQSTTPLVAIGHDGWLFFLKDSGYEKPGAPKPKIAEHVKKWADAFRKRKEFLDSQGIQYILYIAPNKQAIYPEHLPGALRHLADDSPIEELQKQLSGSGIIFVDPRKAIIESKAQSQVYLKLDSHWNDLGSLVAGDPLIEKAQQLFPKIKTLNWKSFPITTMENRIGDLAMMLGEKVNNFESTDIYHHPEIPGSIETKIDLGDEANLVFSHVQMARRTAPAGTGVRLALLHDSFGEYFYRHWHGIADEIIGIPTHALPKKFLAHEKPNLVIQELVERTLLAPAPAE